MQSPPIRAVVTGASSGIGRQIAIELARMSSRSEFGGGGSAESRIVIHYRQNRAGAEETARLVQAHDVSALVVQADICNDDERARLIDQAWSFLGPPTTWVNNAGADVLTGAMRDQTFQRKLDVLMRTDVLSTIELSRSVIQRWRCSDSVELRSDDSDLPPSMTFIGWDQAPYGMEGDAGQMFGPVKAAVMAFAASLAQEVAPHIRVNTVAPGWIKTAWGQTTDAYWDGRARNQSLMNRWGSPDDVAKAVCFVADPSNTFCTGQTIVINGGWDRTHRR